MNKFYIATDVDTCVVMEHVNGDTKEVCRGTELNCHRVILALEFLYVTVKEVTQHQYFTIGT